MVHCSSEAQAAEAIRELGNGWVVLQTDDPKRGVLGYIAFERTVQDPENPLEHFYEWPMFEKPLTPEISFVPAKSLIGFAREEWEFLATCDNAERRWMGFVSYRQADQGKAVVRYSKIEDIQALSEEQRKELWAVSLKCRELHANEFAARSKAASLLSTHEPTWDEDEA